MLCTVPLGLRPLPSTPLPPLCSISFSLSLLLYTVYMFFLFSFFEGRGSRGIICPKNIPVTGEEKTISIGLFFYSFLFNKENNASSRSPWHDRNFARVIIYLYSLFCFSFSCILIGYVQWIYFSDNRGAADRLLPVTEIFEHVMFNYFYEFFLIKKVH